MSDDPMLEYLRERQQELLRTQEETAVRLAEVIRMLEQLADGRTKLGKRVRARTNSGTPGGAAELPLPDRHVSGGAHEEVGEP